ncbi:alpha-ketoglutarate-dependent dioxygenase AlkB family protein [Vibrio neptunius]|uniref:Alpha-ketoglutarate-dependent dioxygenase AlkB n=1 Tax=Vibrio neptunius TaxID=170651 RepID=A0ABS3A6Q6_9VIBR|nr:alpha-ketoglutarate-dependent dioxygenase AlkB [Vibrio neptunius]MBN3495311.1 alpha-ketoglutarate-dependent dioxygenase AlkB [Vibrio neptunius]MBN3517805.1 alpha-ketoglutarate-dependent dioxygenase AlkB [Vibrio neptunius]MBN3552154.1 alpha-ketoglutarate-dependent dioxygenase AlkB [Vibrio neptunius]MBN3580157.1 alpha-ketoglutarate-dependent dioxygenase AlkB [Vibrio neptunius]MCH9873823.1 alpha-ketoglutarate-dependent dioxygenase AlkB [Vibrio neptunius]
MDLFDALPFDQRWIDLPNGRLLWIQDFMSRAEADALMLGLKQNTPWSQQQIQLFGRAVMQPRLQAWYGDKSYTYSGLTMPPMPMDSRLNAIKSRCEKIANQTFNSVLINLYRDGQDSMGAHQDNEPELGPNPTIASLSLGATRRFILKHNQTGQNHKLELSHGSLLIMAGEMQHYWKHSIPKTRQPKDERINLTFRMIY